MTEITIYTVYGKHGKLYESINPELAEAFKLGYNQAKGEIEAQIFKIALFE